MPRASYADWDEDDTFDLADDLQEDEPETRVRRRLPWLRMIVLSGLSVGVLVYFARQEEQSTIAESGAPRAIPASVLVAPPPVWKPVVPANALYGIEKAFAPVALEARQHSSGGREDTLVIGNFGDPRYSRISFVQGIEETKRSFFVDIVRRAADAGLSVSRNAQSRMVATKFGPVEAAAVSLAASGEQNCQAFRFADQEAAFGFQGWLCSAEIQPVDETQLACFIDRLVLTTDGQAALRSLFARTERSRTDACALVARTASIGVRAPSRP